MVPKVLHPEPHTFLREPPVTDYGEFEDIDESRRDEENDAFR